MFFLLITAPFAPVSGAMLEVPAEFATIQEGIDAARSGDTVLVADGTFCGPGNRDIEYHGKGITVMSEHGPESTVIDCENNGRGFRLWLGEGHFARLIGMTVVNGRASYGGGLYCEDSYPTVSHCIFKNNTALYNGGGVCCYEADPALLRCAITENVAEYYGGGMRCDYSSPVLVGTTVSSNAAIGSYAFGGGVYCYDSPALLVNCVISNNTITDYGGGIVLVQRKMEISPS